MPFTGSYGIAVELKYVICRFRDLGSRAFCCAPSAAGVNRLLFTRDHSLGVDVATAQFQLSKTPVLNTINFPTNLVTKATWIVERAQKDPVSEFGLGQNNAVAKNSSNRQISDTEDPTETSHNLAEKLCGGPFKHSHDLGGGVLSQKQKMPLGGHTQNRPNNPISLIDSAMATYAKKEGDPLF